MAHHDQDFYGWTQEQSQLLRSGRYDEVDFESCRVAHRAPYSHHGKRSPT